jgi:RES domain-containing protein
MDGEGARKMGERWNGQGVPVTYLTESRSLAALEIMVHFGRDVGRASWSVIQVEVPDEMIDSVSLRKLPEGWDDRASTSVSQKFGQRWVQSGKSLAILLASAVIPEERILMTNVRHPDLPKLRISRPHPVFFDQRLGWDYRAIICRPASRAWRTRWRARAGSRTGRCRS